MKKRVFSVFVVIALSQVAGCQVTREQGGAAAGAVVGGVVGSQIGGGHGQDIATALGVFAGALAGASIGRSLDQLDEMNTTQALEKNKTNQASSWVNPDSGNTYSVTPTKTYQTYSGRYCREYQSTVIVGGEEQQSYGSACRQPDGDWEIQ
jgi:surface antigen